MPCVMTDSPPGLHRFLQKLHIPLQQPVIHLHELVFFLICPLISNMQIEPEYQELEGACEEKIHKNLKQTERRRLPQIRF